MCRVEANSHWGALASALFYQLLSVHPLHHLLAVSIQVGLLPPLSGNELLALPASSVLSTVALRQPGVLKQFEDVRSSFLHLIQRGTSSGAVDTASSTSTARSLPLSTLLCTPLTTSRLSGGVDGNQYTLHTLWWYCAEAASPAFLHSAAEWAVHATYELLQGHRDLKGEAQDDVGIGSDAYTSHTAMASLSPQSFSGVRTPAHTPPHVTDYPCPYCISLCVLEWSDVLHLAVPGAAAAV